MSKTTTVYLGLGGNIGDTCSILGAALEDIGRLPGVRGLEYSSFFKTPAVSDIPQRDYINAVCRFDTDCDALTLLERMQEIERRYGKLPKQKNAPRTVDIDILFFGSDRMTSFDLDVPHPRWKERLFVLVPLCELTNKIIVGSDEEYDIPGLIQTFPVHEREVILPLCKEIVCNV